MIVHREYPVFDVAKVGGKGYGLLRLAEYGYNVPSFFVITADADISSPQFEEEFFAALSSLGGDRFAVRSSGVGEDGLNSSFAGQFETKLNVGRDEVYAAVRDVASALTRGKKYSQIFSKKSGGMAIVVQRQLDSDISGVMFTSSVLSPDEVTIESTRGLGDKLVGGEVSPQRATLKKSDVPASAHERELVEAACRLEKAEGYPLDIEWAVEGGNLYFLQMRPLTNLGDALPLIPQKNWNFYVFRDFCHLVHSVQIEASRKSLQLKHYGFCMPIFDGLLVNGREFYSDENDAQCLAQWQGLDREEFFDEFIAKIERNTQITAQRADELRGYDASRLDDDALIAKLKEELDAYIVSYLPLMMRPDDYLKQKLVSAVGEGRAKKLLALAIAKPTDTYYSSQREDFARAVIADDFDGYLAKYGWMVSPLKKQMRLLSKADMQRRAEGLSRAQAERELKASYLRKSEDMRKFERAMKNERADVAKLLELTSEFIRLRTYTSENSDRFFYFIRLSLLSELSKRAGVDEATLVSLDVDEVLGALKGVPSKDELLKRSSGELTVFKGEDIKTYYGARTYSVLKKLLPPVDGEGGKVRGDIACPGEAEAKVRIVSDYSDAAKMENGEILVTSMTTPELVFALDKAAGIITDEGGVTCHAAIIAREYAIPCLVGTKCATRVLKDGMRVKLDCVNGFFEIADDNDDR